MISRALTAACLALAAACASAPAAPPAEVSDGRYAMGTVLEVTLQGPDAGELHAALGEIFALADRLDRMLTVFDPASEVSRLNRAAGGDALSVDPEVTRILSDAVGYARATHGAFDVTVEPLVELWTRAARRDALPSAEEIAAARAQVGASRIDVRPDGRVALAPGTSVNLGGLAKGWALDRMLPILRAHGVEGALLNFGQSSTWAVGAPAGAEAWRLLARAPGGGFAGVLALRDRALSVSGSFGQSSVIAGRRFGHVLDPRTGWPLVRRSEALVVAPTAGQGEALSTALLVLGPQEGLALVAAQEGCEALLIDADGAEWTTPGWASVTHFERLDPR